MLEILLVIVSQLSDIEKNILGPGFCHGLLNIGRAINI